MIELDGAISPENTMFVMLCFEGPDVYSTAGGLGTRVTELSEALATQGYTTHLIFIGDPYKPDVEVRVDGRLILKRWSQWGVPYHIYNEIVRPAQAEGKMVVIMGEDWHTAEAICRTSDLLHWFGVRQKVLVLWNLNSLMSLHRINWGRLSFVATLCTVSKYMKHRMWAYGINPLVIPNGIPTRHLTPVDAKDVKRLREIGQQGDPSRLFLFKIGRFDPDKRWIMAVEAVARLKHSGHPVTLFVRGGIEPHGADVLRHAYNIGLTIRDVVAQRPSMKQCMDAIKKAGPADIYNLRFFLPEEFVRTTYAAADATLANSGHEPFGLVALEVMAAEGIAQFLWDQVIENLVGKLEFLARKQNILLA